ncbi:hypothetical protein GLOIN_2v1775190 [Rhizophagus irregularis DAOM 181602=DAOM 197198]|uniref:Uncharacterized protein n=1 Tax=Rhizophagus irregularis (strain DAOM 181602 / DAOM 197198 / MUCL 43194) TaxID=747089 RepID=A0A2P4Q0E2_RHIID|nr:hypothetical protein GLOIN_2v1775190 [Rhizophagus irregularis DAOM 181602=DAOM 197198]POG71125.1 hypothetical protein GLOIN_2v1775190 [Rhizophagus irregularis DAOM 181602=DAOM 197198]|eukprot:XP_025177991.1 hypothetical protein GLOIN_2v1775190 [Rhizophagus irregularis DAOM 181602=DAOM 197198]
MTREKYKLSGYFLMLEEKSNKYNNYAVCQECVRGLGREEAMKQRFTNTKHACAKHLENYNDFDEGKTEVLTPLSSTSTPSQGSSNLNNFFYKSSRANSISSISDISFRSFGPLDLSLIHI